jgi:flagellar biosynthesis/type III secretory pathway chaperone
MLDQGNFVANCLMDVDCQIYFKNLIDTLTKELAIYQELKMFLLQEKMMLLKSSSIEQLNQNNSVKENIILKARILEEGRTIILKKIARCLDIDDEAVRLISLANYAEDQQREDIERLRDDLVNIAQEIRAINSENKYLLDTSINNVKGSLDFISSLINRSGVYLGNGTISEIKKNGSLLRTEG